MTIAMRRFVLFIFILFSCVFQMTTRASEYKDGLQAFDPVITKVKGKRVLIKKGIDSIEEGDRFIAYDELDRGKAVIRIFKVGKNLAVGKVIEGRARKGWILELEEAPKRSGSRRSPSSFEYGDITTDRPVFSKNSMRLRNSVGILGGTSANTMSVGIPGEEDSVTTASMLGSTSEFHLYFDVSLSRSFSLVLSAGQQEFQAAGEVDGDICNESSFCEINVKYLVGVAMLRYHWVVGSFEPWLALGGGMIKPDDKQKTTNVFDESSIEATGIAVGSLGLEWRAFRRLSVQVQGRYTRQLHEGETVAEVISVLGGLAFHF